MYKLLESAEFQMLEFVATLLILDLNAENCTCVVDGKYAGVGVLIDSAAKF